MAADLSDQIPIKQALVTGATGFIGSRLVDALLGAGVDVAALVRDPDRARARWPEDSVHLFRADLAQQDVDLGRAFEGIDTVFHLAGYAHASDTDTDTVEQMHQQVTVVGTARLLEAARDAGVSRVIFVSSVKAMGEGGAECLDERSPAHPTSVYGRAKLEAERLVLEAGAHDGFHAAVLRLPLVYGPAVKGNLYRMLAAIDRGRYPPLPESGNRRSMVDVRDVVQAMLLAAEGGNAGGQLYLVTDGEDYSSRQVYEWMCRALGRSVPRWSVPLGLLHGAGRLGDFLKFIRLPSPLTTEQVEKLLGSACYRSEKISRELGFVPRYRLPDVIPDMVRAYRSQGHG